jgi:hypothetical protein
MTTSQAAFFSAESNEKNVSPWLRESVAIPL